MVRSMQCLKPLKFRLDGELYKEWIDRSYIEETIILEVILP